MKKIFAILSILVASACSPASNHPETIRPDVILVDNGRPVSTIVLPKHNSHLKIAAGELIEHIRKATGATLPVATEEEQVEGVKLYLGESKHTKALGIDESRLGGEAFVIQADRDAVAIVGNTEYLIDGWYRQKTNGNLWGVYHFLETFLGIRWYLPHRLGTIIPEHRTLVIPGGTAIKIAPNFPIREFWPIMSFWNHRNAKKYIEIDRDDAKRFALRMREANAYGDVQANHSMIYFHRLHHDRPELFALKTDGTRALYPPRDQKSRNYNLSNWHGYVDYANPEALEQAIKDHIAFYENTDPAMKKEWLRVHPEHAPNDFRVAFNPSDGMLASQTDEAKKLFRPDIPWGSNSNYVFKFANKLAWALYERYPKKKFVSLAYSSFAMPPDPEVVGEFPPSFLIQIAVLQPMAHWKEPKIYAQWNDVVARWRALGSNKVHFWHYACWPSLPNVPFFWPGLYQKFYQQHKDYALGAFVNGGPPGGIIGMHHLNYYFGQRVLFDLDYDIKNGIREYCDLMFGPASGAMHAFHSTIISQWETVIWDMPPTQRLPNSQMLFGDKGTFPKSVVADLQKYLTDALKTKGLTEIQKERIEWTAKSHQPFFEQARAIQSGGMPYFYAVGLSAAPKIDGVFDDAVWNETEWLTMNRDMAVGSELEVGSRLKIGWHGDSLYLAIENMEPFMNRLQINEKSGGRVHADDCNEIYLDPANSRSDHLHLMYNAAGESLFSRTETGYRDSNWSPHGSTVVHKRLADRWVTEMKFPFSSLGVAAFDAPARWVWNVFRHRRAAPTPHYIALMPTNSSTTKQFTIFPQLLLINAPSLYSTFDDTYRKEQGISAWHRETRKIARPKTGLSLQNKDGRRVFSFDPAVLPPDQKQWYKTVSGIVYGSPETQIKITDQTSFDMQVRWDGEEELDIQIHGRVRKDGKGDPQFFASSLYRGKSKNEWINIQKKFVTVDGKSGVKIEPGDVVTKCNVYVTVPATGKTVGEIERIVIGEETVLSVVK